MKSCFQIIKNQRPNYLEGVGVSASRPIEFGGSKNYPEPKP
jgi:hypothetical protein